MKNKDFEKLAKQLRMSIPGSFTKGALTVTHPVTDVLRGLYFEPSSFDSKSFFVWVFFLPLFVPTSQISFNLGKRLREPGGGDRWSVEMPNMIADLEHVVLSEALQLLNRIESPEDVVKVAMEGKVIDPYVQQAVAYACARSGNVQRANEELDRLLSMLDIEIPWQREIAGRAVGLQSKLMTSLLEAQNQLQAWQIESVKNLGLQQI